MITPWLLAVGWWQWAKLETRAGTQPGILVWMGKLRLKCEPKNLKQQKKIEKAKNITPSLQGIMGFILFGGYIVVWRA